MANKEHLKIAKQSARAWNDWREENLGTMPDLSGADLNGVDLADANLVGANLNVAKLDAANLEHANLNKAGLHKASLIEANLSFANLSYADLGEAVMLAANLDQANLSEASLMRANLNQATLRAADLSGATLNYASLGEGNLTGAKLGRANFSDADLINTNLSDAELSDTILNGALMWGTIFSNNDLSTVTGLETVRHAGPSTIGVDTLFKSDGKIPELFLRGVGVPEDFITFVPSLVGRAIEFYSCFISYSHQDEEFSQRLRSRMRSESLRVWYAPEDMKGGRKLHEEIFRAIQIHDKLLLVLSENSMKSEWVSTEIRRARKVEREESRRKLFPIRLVEFDAIQKWECFDADSGKDLAVELREYYIPDFSNWKDHDAFEAEFAKLLRDLRATEG